MRIKGIIKSLEDAKKFVIGVSIALLRNHTEWIKAEAEHMPDDNEKVIVYGCLCETNIKLEQMVAKRVCGAWFSYPGGYEIYGKVTHWHPLPKPPI